MINPNSLEWMELKEILEDRIADLREKNDKSMSIEKTERIRGQIAELKFVLEIPNKKESPKQKTVDYKLD